MTNDQPYLNAPELAAVKATADVTIACANPGIISQVAQLAPNSAIISIDLSQPISTDTLKHQGYDVIIIADLASYGQRMELVLSKIKAILAPGGRLCILVDEPALAFFETNKCVQLKDRTIVRGEGQGLVVVRESIFSNGVDRNGTHPSDQVKLIVPATITDHIQAVIGGLVTVLESQGQEVELVSLNTETSNLAGKVCISLLELQESVLENLTPTNFSFVQHLMLQSASLMWITGLNGPSSRIVDGLARVVRNENPGLQFRTFHAGYAAVAPLDLAHLISKAFLSKSEDDEYIVKDGIIHVGRIQEDEAINLQLNSLLPGAAKGITKIALKEAPHALKLTVQSPGMLDSFCMEIDEGAAASLGSTSVEVAVQVSSIK
jgi:zearalenone synthase (highly reducing iterative type I polyketide synthase)